MRSLADPAIAGEVSAACLEQSWQCVPNSCLRGPGFCFQLMSQVSNVRKVLDADGSWARAKELNASIGIGRTY